MKSHEETKIIYSSGLSLKSFSIRNLRSQTLHCSKSSITAITKNLHYENHTNVVSFGLEDGTIKDYDMN